MLSTQHQQHQKQLEQLQVWRSKGNLS
jgi:hypothetical protein